MLNGDIYVSSGYVIYSFNGALQTVLEVYNEGIFADEGKLCYLGRDGGNLTVYSIASNDVICDL